MSIPPMPDDGVSLGRSGDDAGAVARFATFVPSRKDVP